MKSISILLGSAACALALPATAPLPAASPESEGFSVARLERLHAFMRREIDTGEFLGAVTLIGRHGRIVDWHAYGHRDLARTAPMATDAIFRIYSMTKPMTSVAVLMLMEEGKFTLDDPIGKFLPELADVRVFAGGTAEAPVLRAPARPITILHLLTHTAGFATGANDPAAARELYGRHDLHQCPDLATYCEKLGRLPLAADPGERFAYDGVSLEVLSRLVEVVSGATFEGFLQRRLFAPLALADTSFTVPPEKRPRLVDLCTSGPDGRLMLSAEKPATHPGERMSPYCSGAGGLYSTAGDYARFCQMLLNGGELDGASLLGRKTVELMMRDHLARLDPHPRELAAGEGFGLGGSVLIDPAARGRPGSPGQFGWMGAASTYFTIDPREQLIALLLMQHLPSSQHSISGKFYTLVYQSLIK